MGVVEPRLVAFTIFTAPVLYLAASLIHYARPPLYLAYFLLSLPLLIRFRPGEGLSTFNISGERIAVAYVTIFSSSLLYGYLNAVAQIDITQYAFLLNFASIGLILLITRVGTSIFFLTGLTLGLGTLNYTFLLTPFLIEMVMRDTLIKLMSIEWSKVLMIINRMIAAPLVEELLFRGLIFRKLLETGVGLHMAAVVQTVLFAGFHWHAILSSNYAWLIPAAILGLVTAYVYYYTSRLTFPILIHGLGNLISSF